jgi:hypothetical protein
MWCHAMPIDGESVNLPKPFLVKAGLLWCYLLFMCDDVPCTWLPAIAYQRVCTTRSETLLIPTVYLTELNVLAGAEHKLLKLVSLIHKCIKGAYLAQQNRVSNS